MIYLYGSTEVGVGSPSCAVLSGDGWVGGGGGGGQRGSGKVAVLISAPFTL